MLVREKPDSNKATLFISKVYKKLIDEHVPNSFIKLAGDGLLVVVSLKKGKSGQSTCLG
jgi:hypothetical protein